MKKPTKGTRVVLGLRVRPEVKNRIDTAAKESGRTQSQEAEYLIESGLLVTTALKATGSDSQQLIDAVFRKSHEPIHTPYGKIWVPKGHPKIRGSHGEFIPGDYSKKGDEQ